MLGHARLVRTWVPPRCASAASTISRNAVLRQITTLVGVVARRAVNSCLADNTNALVLAMRVSAVRARPEFRLDATVGKLRKMCFVTKGEERRSVIETMPTRVLSLLVRPGLARSNAVTSAVGLSTAANTTARGCATSNQQKPVVAQGRQTLSHIVPAERRHSQSSPTRLGDIVRIPSLTASNGAASSCPVVTKMSSYVIQGAACRAWKRLTSNADADARLRRLSATRARKSCLSVLVRAKYCSIADATIAMRGAVLVSERQPSAKASSANNVLLEARRDPSMTDSRPSISALCSVEDC